jgi:hypothetical protein
MSVWLTARSLSPDHWAIIKKLLVIIPEVPTHQKMMFETEKTPITLWNYIAVTDTLVLPAFFAQALVQQPINSIRVYPPAPLKFLGELRENQIPVITEAREHLQKYNTTSLNVNCGAGKTVMAGLLSTEFDGIRMVIHPIELLNSQWADMYRRMCNARVHIVENEEFPTSIAIGTVDVIICMTTRIHRVPRELLQAVRVLILDEAHKLCTPSSVAALLATRPQKIISCTATPNRVDGLEKIIHAICGTHNIVRISQKPFKVFRILTGITHDEEHTERGINWNDILSKQISHPSRTQYIQELIRVNPKFRILVLSHRKELVRVLYEGLKATGQHVDFLCGTKKTYDDRCRVLVAGIKKAGTGFDEQAKPSEYIDDRFSMLILVTSMKSLTEMEQSVGRVFRSNMPVIYDIVDDNKIFKRHFGVRKGWYVSRNGTIIDVKLK